MAKQWITLLIEDELLRRVSRLTRITDKSKLVKKGLETLLSRESARRLADLGGSVKNLKKIPRRRFV